MNEDESADYRDGFRDGRSEGVWNVVNALARACAAAVESGDEDKARRFADASRCVLELFPEQDYRLGRDD